MFLSVGAPGVEYSAEHDVDGGVAKLLFLPHQVSGIRLIVD
jgi:hypothetical protein